MPDLVCSTTGEICGAYVENATNPILDIYIDPPLADEEITMYQVCENVAGEVQYHYDITLNNPGDAYASNVTVQLRRDLDGNGQVDSL